MALQVGDLVYCRVASAERDLDPVLACTDAQGKVYTSVATIPAIAMLMLW